MAGRNILICDDDENLGIMLRGFLRFNNYKVVLAQDGQEGLEALQKESFDLAVLDVMMPRIDGLELAKKISSSPKMSMPIIFLTAKDQKKDILSGYKVGGSDYLTKPFDSELLLYKIEALLKHSGKRETSGEDQVHKIENVSSNKHYLFDKYKFVPILRELINTDTSQTIHLTPKETELLKRFCESEKKLVKKSTILNEVWGNTSFLSNRSMNVFLVKIRKYFKDSDSIKIKSIYKVGYKFSVDGGVKTVISED